MVPQSPSPSLSDLRSIRKLRLKVFLFFTVSDPGHRRNSGGPKSTPTWFIPAQTVGVPCSSRGKTPTRSRLYLSPIRRIDGGFSGCFLAGADLGCCITIVDSKDDKEEGVC